MKEKYIYWGIEAAMESKEMKETGDNGLHGCGCRECEATYKVYIREQKKSKRKRRFAVRKRKNDERNGR